MRDATIPIDKAGRIVLPKELRDSFRLKSGDRLAIEVKEDAIHLRPANNPVRLERVNGVLVLSGDVSIPEGVDLVEEVRNERLAMVSENLRKR